MSYYGNVPANAGLQEAETGSGPGHPILRLWWSVCTELTRPIQQPGEVWPGEVRRGGS